MRRSRTQTRRIGGRVRRGPALGQTAVAQGRWQRDAEGHEEREEDDVEEELLRDDAVVGAPVSRRGSGGGRRIGHGDLLYGISKGD